MDKSHIIKEIKRIALTNDGKAPGREKFERESGVKMSEWYPHLWLRWGDALQEAGFAPNKMATALSNDSVVQKYIELIREFGRLPLDGEVRRKEKQDSTFPSHGVFARFGGKRNLVAKILDYCTTHQGFEDISAICESSPQHGKIKEESSRAPIQGYVYMMRSGRRYKIGHTSSPTRRHREVRLDLPEPTDLVHSIETDDPSGIEKYWHRRFEAKRIRDTEFFTLDLSDVAAFKRRKYQ